MSDKASAITEQNYHTLAAQHGYEWQGKRLPENTGRRTTWRCKKHHSPFIASFNEVANDEVRCWHCERNTKPNLFPPYTEDSEAR